MLKFRTDDGSNTSYDRDVESAVDEEGFKNNKKNGFKQVTLAALCHATCTCGTVVPRSCAVRSGSDSG
jgi:hypothetical protein